MIIKDHSTQEFPYLNILENPAREYVAEDNYNVEIRTIKNYL